MDIQTFLHEQYNLRRNYHPRFSVRAFARLLETDPSSLVKVMKGHRHPKPETLNKWLKNLHVEADIRPQKKEKKPQSFSELDSDDGTLSVALSEKDLLKVKKILVKARQQGGDRLYSVTIAITPIISEN